MASEDPKCCCDLEPHPDHLISESFLLQGGKRWQLLPYYCHILYAEAIVQAGLGTTQPYVKLFTTEDPDTQTDDDSIWTLAPAATLGSSAWTPPEIRGVPAAKGLFAHIETADTTTYVIINIIAVRREHYTPAFPNPTQWLLNAWKCWNSDELYSNFDTGENSGWDNDGSSTTAAGGLGSEQKGF